MLERELYLTATDLDTTDRVVIGDGDWRDVPISRAVAASTAMPLVYEPVEIKGRELTDGDIRSTTNVDIAVEKGAKFIVVVNPIVPFVNDFSKRVPTITGSRVRRVSDMGFVAIANQAIRMIAHDRLHRAVERWEIEYPGVDILLIEPEFDDELMFGTSIRTTRRGSRSPSTGSSRSRSGSPATTSATRRLPSGTGSRSRPAGSSTCSIRSNASATPRPPGAGSSSRRPARCCARATPARYPGPRPCRR
jgi:hypothetical protein